MEGHAFLSDLAVVMIVAGVVTILFHRLKQPVVVGYLLAGVIIGPHTPPFPLIRDEATIRTLAELGVVFLMFSIGLDFTLAHIRGIGPTVLVAGVLGTLVVFWFGYEAGRLFGWGPMNRIFLGAMLSISSTMIVARTFKSLSKQEEGFTRVVFGITVVEDLVAMLMIALLSGIALTGKIQALPVAQTGARLLVFLVVAVVMGLLLVPRLLKTVSRFKDAETLLVVVLGLCFGASLLSVSLGYSTALGAFVMGAVIASTRESGRVRQLVEPLRDMFSAVFFVSMGLMVDPRLMIEHAGPIAVLSAVVVVGKALACALGAFVAGHDLRTAIRIGMSLGQIGEFSFVIASLGVALGVTDPFLHPIAVCVSVVTAFLNLPLTRHADRFAAWAEGRLPARLRGHMALYSQWIGNLAATGANDPIGYHIRRAIWQIFLNVSLITAAFAVAAYLARYHPEWAPPIPAWLGGPRILLWLGAMLATAPLYVATLRKFNALAMLWAELAVPASQGGASTPAVRSLVSTTILLAGVAAMLVYTMLLSAALLPPGKVLLVLAVVAVPASFLFWNAFVKIYAKAQIALRDAVTPTPPRARPKPRSERMLPREAQIEPVSVAAGSLAAGKLLRELDLRAKTGANVVGVTRGETSQVNPSPDEEIQAGDVLLVLGNAAQVSAARAWLAQAAPGSAAEAPPSDPPAHEPEGV